MLMPWGSALRLFALPWWLILASCSGTLLEGPTRDEPVGSSSPEAAGPTTGNGAEPQPQGSGGSQPQLPADTPPPAYSPPPAHHQPPDNPAIQGACDDIPKTAFPEEFGTYPRVIRLTASGAANGSL